MRYYSQAIGCAIGSLGNKVALDSLYGRKCLTSNLNKLKLALAYHKIIENYLVKNEEILASRTILYNSGTTGSISLTVNGVNTGRSVVNYNTNMYYTIIDLQTAIAANTSYYNGLIISNVVALGDQTSGNPQVQITIQAPTGTGLSGNDISVELNNITGDNVFQFNSPVYLQGGQDPIEDGEDCFTDEDIQNIIIPAISSLLKITLPLPGIITSSGTTNTSQNPNLLRVITSGEERITTSGDNRSIK